MAVSMQIILRIKILENHSKKVTKTELYGIMEKTLILGNLMTTSMTPNTTISGNIKQ